MKRTGAWILAAMLAVLVAGSAFAGPRVGYGGGWGWDGQYGPGGRRGHQMMMGPYGFMGPVDPKDVPKEVQDLMREAERLHLQMRMAFTEEKVDRAKVLGLHDKLHDLHGKIARWRLEEAIKRANAK